MHKLSQEQIKQIQQLTASGVSLNKIFRKVGCSKTAAYNYFVKVKGRTYFQPKIHFVNLEEEGEILGLFAGDGCLTTVPRLYRYVVRITFGRGKVASLHRVKPLLERNLGKRFSIKSDGCCFVLETMSKKIYDYFLTRLDFDSHEKSPSVKLREIPSDERFKIGFIRGLIDTDGTVCRQNHCKVPQIAFYTTSPTLAEQVLIILSDLNFSTTKTVLLPGTSRRIANYPLFKIRIRNSACERFLSEIRPFRGVLWARRSTVDRRYGKSTSQIGAFP